MDYSNFQDWEIKELAKRNGQTAEEWKAEQDALAVKQNKINLQEPGKNILKQLPGKTSILINKKLY